MAVLHQEVNAMLFLRDRKRIIFRDTLQDFHIAYIQLVAARGTLVRAYFAGNYHARFVSKVLERVKNFRRHLVLRHNALNHAGAIAKDGKDELAAFALVVQPAPNGNGLAVMPANIRDGGYWCL